MKYDTNETYKYMRVAGPAIYLVGFMGFLIGLYSISKDKTYIIHILYGVIMLACLPATLFSASVAFIIGGNI
jgi:predicted Na+-dependent transporter